MRTAIGALLALCLVFWFGFALILSGFLKFDEVDLLFPAIRFPETTGEIGASLNIIQGIFSSLAVVLALVAVFIQGKELKESTSAQREQARALSNQLELQNEVIRLNAYSTRLQFLVAEIERLENQILKLVTEVESSDGQGDDKKKWDIIRSSRKLQISYRKDAKEIDQSIVLYLNASSQGRYAEI